MIRRRLRGTRRGRPLSPLVAFHIIEDIANTPRLDKMQTMRKSQSTEAASHSATSEARAYADTDVADAEEDRIAHGVKIIAAVEEMIGVSTLMIYDSTEKTLHGKSYPMVQIVLPVPNIGWFAPPFCLSRSLDLI